eukprot:GHVS01026012.1.p1 GENE.GHVS01026012.1~~GHVS01026012.1.p1  ORF type:complete len:424 (-),score=138.60 GHVS01026012.1:251-1489(-)
MRSLPLLPLLLSLFCSSATTSAATSSSSAGSSGGGGGGRVPLKSSFEGGGGGRVPLKRMAAPTVAEKKLLGHIRQLVMEKEELELSLRKAATSSTPAPSATAPPTTTTTAPPKFDDKLAPVLAKLTDLGVIKLNAQMLFKAIMMAPAVLAPLSKPIKVAKTHVSLAKLAVAPLLFPAAVKLGPLGKATAVLPPTVSAMLAKLAVPAAAAKATVVKQSTVVELPKIMSAAQAALEEALLLGAVVADEKVAIATNATSDILEEVATMQTAKAAAGLAVGSGLVDVKDIATGAIEEFTELALDVVDDMIGSKQEKPTLPPVVVDAQTQVDNSLIPTPVVPLPPTRPLFAVPFPIIAPLPTPIQFLPLVPKGEKVEEAVPQQSFRGTPQSALVDIGQLIEQLGAAAAQFIEANLAQ